LCAIRERTPCPTFLSMATFWLLYFKTTTTIITINRATTRQATKNRDTLLWYNFHLLVPSAQPVRVNGPHGRSALPKRPRRIHDVAVLWGLFFKFIIKL
jgi:hypothetical protein